MAVAAAAPAPTVRSLLGTPAVARLFATSILARVPLATIGIVAILRTRELTGSYAAGGAAAAAFALASGCSQPLLARLVDRGGQARVLLPGALVTAVALVVFALLPAGTPLPAIMATTLVAGLATPPLGASMRTLLPGVMGSPERLHAAYALESSALEITYVVGPLVLAGALATWSTTAATLACAALLLGGTLAFLATPASRAWRPAAAPPVGHGWLGALRSPGVRTLLVLLALMGMTFGAVEVGVPAAAEAEGHRDAAGPLLSVWGLGSMLGGLLAMRLRRPAGPVARLTATICALATGHLLLGVAGNLVVLGGLLLLAGVSIAPSFASAFGLTDGLAPPGALTEAFAWLGSGIAGGLAAGSALGGWAAEYHGADAALLVAGLAGLTAVAVIATRRGTLTPC
ncbi:MAG TPA: MFS transporter [Solirubrobacteraceae bacterium]|nr:MFS transporter [Solirubrobacteraceae bacterium]